MNTQALFEESRVLHIRELKTENAELKARNKALQDENAALRESFDLALLAAEDLKALPEGGKMALVDGWNLILGAGRTAKDREALIAQWRNKIGPYDAEKGTFNAVWIVFDGPKEHVRTEGGLRISYTGGTGAHRADRFISDYVRMAAYLGLASRLEVITRDRDFAKTIKRLQAL